MNLKKLQPEHVSAEPGSDLDGPWEPPHAPPRRAGQRGDRRATAGRAGRRGLGAGAALSADGGVRVWRASWACPTVRTGVRRTDWDQPLPF